MNNYKILLLVDNDICDNGNETADLESLKKRFDNKRIAIIPLEELPDDWQQMTIIDGQLVPASAEVIAERVANKLEQKERAEMDELEQYLASTDWVVIKCLEKNLSVEQVYPTIFNLRNEKRERLSILKERYE